MNINPSSSQVKVFPSAKRVNYQKTSRIFTESTLKDMQVLVSDKKSFVMSHEIDNYTIEFVVDGYYFKLTSIDSITSNFNDKIYANITVTEEILNIDDFSELNGQDEDNVYKGLTLTDNPLTDSAESLLILKKENNGWIIPEESMEKLTWKSLPNSLDCGTT